MATTLSVRGGVWSSLVALIAATLAAYLIASKVLDPGPRSARARSGYETIEKRWAYAKDELTELKGHPWAGVYSEGSGLDSGSLILAPKTGYVYSGPTSSSSGYGPVREEGGRLIFSGNRPGELAEGLHVVPWGERVYLIPPPALIEFANEVNQGSEPAYGSGLIRQFFSRVGDWGRPVRGFPVLPAGADKYILKKPINATVAHAGVTVYETPDRYKISTTIILDVGRRQGVLPQMVFVPQGKDRFGDAIVERTGENSSVVRFVRFPDSSGPRPGGAFSTRGPYAKGFDPEPMRWKIARLSGKAWPVVKDHLYSYGWNAEQLRGAQAKGFQVAKVGRISIRAGNEALLSGDAFQDKLESELAGMGANIYFTRPYRKDKNLPCERTYEGYRLAWKDRLVDWSDLLHIHLFFHGSDWQALKRIMDFHDCRFAVAYDKARHATVRDLLHLSEKEYESIQELRIEDLRPEQRSALESLWGVRSPIGLVMKANRDELAWKQWPEKLDVAFAPRLEALRTADPVGYAEYRRLEEAIYPPKASK